MKTIYLKLKSLAKKILRSYRVIRSIIISLYFLPRVKGVLFVHDAHKHGAQLLGLSMIKDMAQKYGHGNVMVFLLGNGDLERDFQKYNCIRCAPHRHYLWKVFSFFLNRDCFLIFNSLVTQSVSPFFLSERRKSIALIHELPTLIKEYNLHQQAAQVNSCNVIVFPAELVKSRFLHSFGNKNSKSRHLVFPQGAYQGHATEQTDGTLKSELNISKDSYLVANIAYGDIRKAPDIFILTAITYFKKYPDSNVHFLWIGEIEPKFRLWLNHDIELTDSSENIHFLNFRSDPDNIYKSIDCLFLSSREDPLPSTVIETYFSKKPIVLFNNSTGYTGIVSQQFKFINYLDINMAIECIHSLSNDTKSYPNESLFYSSKEYLERINRILDDEV